MATSTEQINELIAGNTALKAYFEGARDSIEERVQAALDTLPDFYKVFYVSPNGDDGNDGLTLDAAFATVRKAIAACPNGGKVEILLEGPYEYDLEPYQDWIYVGARAVRFGTTGVNGRATLKPFINTSGDKSIARGLNMGFQGGIFHFTNLILDTGDLAAVGFTPYDGWGGLVTRGGAQGSHASFDMSFDDCEIRLNDHQLWSANANVRAYFNAVTVVRTGDFTTLNDGFSSTLTMMVRSLTLPSGETLADFTTGIVRDANGRAINILSNLEI